jgi:hypothetical protein
MSAKLGAFWIWLFWFGILTLCHLIFAPLLMFVFRSEPLPDASDLSALTASLAICAILATVGTLILWAIPIRRPLWSISFGAIFSTALLLLIAGFGFLLFSDFESRAGLVGFAMQMAIPNGFAGAFACYMRNRESL